MKAQIASAELAHVEFAHDMVPFAGRELFAMGEAHGMQRSVNTVLPEFDEFEEARVIGGQIIILPDKTVQDMGMIGHAVDHFRRGQAIAREQQFNSACYPVIPLLSFPLLESCQRKDNNQ